VGAAGGSRKLIVCRHCEQSEAIQAEMPLWIASSLLLLAMTIAKKTP
jgi:hypothetical protein